MLSLLLLAAAPADTFDAQINCAKDDYQLALNVCAWRAYRSADAAMVEQWRKSLAAAEALDRANASLDSPRGRPKETARNALLQSQRGFLTYREETCEVVYIGEFTGSIAPMDQGNCLTKITEARTKQLQEMLGSN